MFVRVFLWFVIVVLLLIGLVQIVLVEENFIIVQLIILIQNFGLFDYILLQFEEKIDI